MMLGALATLLLAQLAGEVVARALVALVAALLVSTVRGMAVTALVLVAFERRARIT